MSMAAEVGVIFFPDEFEAVESLGKEAGLHFANAGESPAGDDDVLYEDLLGGADWLVFFFEGKAELFELNALFDGGQNDFGGGETVFEGVVAHSGASLGCYRAVAPGCVNAGGV